jgi:hypothetical protein
MSTRPRPGRTDSLLAGGAVLMILCCAVGPAVIGATAGAAIGGWLGIVCAVILAAVAASVLHRRRRSGGC